MPRPRPRRKHIKTATYKGPDRRSGWDRRRLIDRRKLQKPAVEGMHERELGKHLGGIEDWLPLRIKAPDERKGKERRSGEDRRKKH